tara:strand:- start:665 stop:1693 length:1029 start_codon:yes stop_codon:yes gene_type:complete
MSESCLFIPEYENPCLRKIKYGNYCYKHRHNYLIVDGYISRERFTGFSKDYLKKDLLKYYREKMGKNSIIPSKKELFNEIKGYISSLNSYYEEDKLKDIILIQSLVRGTNIRNNLYNKCNNDEDFYTYDLLKDIPQKYFYSYRDSCNIKWGFDIRSLDKLFQMGFPNPYTTEMIPPNIIDDVKNKMNKLKNELGYEDLTDTIVRDRKDAIKQKIVDLFSFIEQSGYTCQIEWFTALSLRRLKELYKQLEDIWNYRSQINDEMKRNICPPNADIFKTPMIEVMNYTIKEDLQELILHEVMKFTQANTDSDRKLGFMYFLIAFGMVSQPCYLAHIEWLEFMMQT